MTVAEQTQKLSGDVLSAGPILMTKKNIVLHVNNYAKLGGIETTVIDIAHAFPQFHHVLLTVNPNGEDLSFVRFAQNQHLEYMNACGKITKSLLAEINPGIVFLHNTKGDDLEGEFPYMWLRKYRVIGAHHMVTSPLIPADFDWFVSDWVRVRYSNCENRMKDRAVTLPPCINTAPYMSLCRIDRKPVVGRVQSGTWSARGKWPGSFYTMLRKLKGCDYFLVGSPTQESWFRSAPIKAGGMPAYLKEIDIFVIWGDTTESWSKAATEAMASGIPVVAKDNNDGLAEQLRASGVGFLVKTEEEFVDKVQYLIEHPEIRQMCGEKGREWVQKYASMNRFKKVFADMFLEWSVA